MAVLFGTIETFPNPKADRAQALKILEESAEVFSAMEQMEDCATSIDDDCKEWACYETCMYRGNLVDEIADTIQACANLLQALGVDDMRAAMQACRVRNVDRGRM